MVTIKDYIQMCFDFSNSDKIRPSGWFSIPRLGIIEEVGEVAHPFKSYFLNRESQLDVDNVKEEIGDVFFVVVLYEMRRHFPYGCSDKEGLASATQDIESAFILSDELSDYHCFSSQCYDRADFNILDSQWEVTDVLAMLAARCSELIFSNLRDADTLPTIFKLLSTVCYFIGSTLEEVIEQNYNKIKARHNIGTSGNILTKEQQFDIIQCHLFSVAK